MGVSSNYSSCADCKGPVGKMAGYSSLVLLLLLAASVSLSWAVFLGSSLRDEKGTRQFIKRSSPFRPSPTLKDKLSESKPFSYPSALLGVRERRSDVVGEKQCGLPKSSVLLETDPVRPLVEKSSDD